MTTKRTRQISKTEVSRKALGRTAHITLEEVQWLVTEEVVTFQDAPAEPTPEPTPTPVPPVPVPTGQYPDPPRLEKTANTVLLWDWDVTKIEDPTATDPTQQVSSANNVFARDPQPGDPLNSDHCYTKVVRATQHNVVEMGANDDAVKRPEGTAARLFIKQWGFMQKFTGKVMTCDFAIYLPDEFVIKQGAGVGLGLGVQNKNPDVSYGLNAVRPTVNDPLTLLVWGRVTGSLTHTRPLKPLAIPFKQWVPIRYHSLLHKTAGWLDIYVMGEKLFHLEGRTDVAGFGFDIYNIHSVSGLARQVVSNMRIDIAP